jgi:hypothetical protein
LAVGHVDRIPFDGGELDGADSAIGDSAVHTDARP